ncbi:ADP-ribosylglycohydrolase family protein [Streptomyces sp. NPDC002886]|uniref:ADP-ribosylglycohydrolase family protein n=1 Tax=Streptomyces sp. NPDC002886 TaxID=3364667 RepID=UPI00368A4F34
MTLTPTPPSTKTPPQEPGPLTNPQGPPPRNTPEAEHPRKADPLTGPNPAEALTGPDPADTPTEPDPEGDTPAVPNQADALSGPDPERDTLTGPNPADTPTEPDPARHTLTGPNPADTPTGPDPEGHTSAGPNPANAPTGPGPEGHTSAGETPRGGAPTCSALGRGAAGTPVPEFLRSAPAVRGHAAPGAAGTTAAPVRGPGGLPPVSGRGGYGESPPAPEPAPAGHDAPPRTQARTAGAVDAPGRGTTGGTPPLRAATGPGRPHTAPAEVAGGPLTAPSGPAPRDAQPRTATAKATATAPRTEADPVGPRRIEGLLLGLAAGDAAGWPAARHRASRMPEWTRRLTRELDTFAEQNATTTLPVPIALNQPPEPLRLGPSDDAEWAAFAAESVLTAAGVLLSDLSRSRRMRAAIDLAWNALASEVAAAAERAPEVESAVLPLRARISVRAGLGNLAAGLRPPATGHDNPHYFDDAACIRACVLAVVHPGDPEAAADLAEFDARYTQDGDGVHGARAMAAAIATALASTGTCTAADTDAAVDAALAQLPESTEIGRNARHAVKLARAERGAAGGAFAIVPLLEHQIVDHVYSYGIAAAETVPVALALATAARGRVGEAVPAAACLSRVADSAPALAGALTGALGGGDSLPAAWREACRVLSGCALPRLAGTDLVELAALLTRTELTSPKPQGKPRT